MIINFNFSVFSIILLLWEMFFWCFSTLKIYKIGIKITRISPIEIAHLILILKKTQEKLQKDHLY